VAHKNEFQSFKATLKKPWFLGFRDLGTVAMEPGTFL
jgi:hypothetical protein